jgi:hypothetical protein
LGINPRKKPLDIDEYSPADSHHSTLKAITVPMKEEPANPSGGEGRMFLTELINSPELRETALLGK